MGQLNPRFRLSLVSFDACQGFTPLISLHFLKLTFYTASYLFFSAFIPSPHSCPFPLSLTWTLTVHLRNSAFSAVHWCLIANRFSPCPPSLHSPIFLPPTQFSPPPRASTSPPSVTHLSGLAQWPACAGLGACLNLVMRSRGDKHLLGPPAVSDRSVLLSRPVT